jgi:2-polyprenyl-6-methoxyphenol hydroxylase-like FAD-dependent oxidoreductase
MDTEYDVAIVGGGPTGLWLAAELALAKVRVIVLERRAERVKQSRGLAIHGRTLEVMALRGLADRFLSRGRPSPHFHFGVSETPLDFSGFDSRFPFVLLLPQAVSEEILEQHALTTGAEIRRSALVDKIEQSEDRVIIFGRDSNASFQIFARYVVGADGSRSMVRRQADIAFLGDPAQYTMMLGDVILDSRPETPLFTAVNEEGGLLVVPLPDGVHHRLAMVDARSTFVPPDTPLVLEELAAAAARIARTDFRPREPVWLSRFTDETRVAQHYRSRRIFLAGDAAHIHAPMGGQGMNVGIQDAMNLGWKLASVVKGNANELLLDSYERERWPVGDALRRNTLAQMRLFAAFDPASSALRAMFEDILRIGELNRQLAEEVSGFGVAYPEPLFAASRGWEHRQDLSGRRLPDMDLVLKDGSSMTLYRLLEAGRWVQLQNEATDASTAFASDEITVVDLAPDTRDRFSDGRYSLLVRPDGYLSHVRASHAC